MTESKIKIQYEDKNEVPYYWSQSAGIVLSNDGSLYVRGYVGTPYYTQADVHEWKIPVDLIGEAINETLDSIRDYCAQILELRYSDADSDIDLNPVEEIEIITAWLWEDETARARVFRADPEVMTDWFVNGESPEFIEAYVLPRLVHENEWVFFPDTPAEYREAAEKYYRLIRKQNKSEE